MDFQKVKELYLKSLIDKASPEEEAQVEAYLKANPQYSSQLIDYAKEQLHAVKEYDGQAALQKVRQIAKPKIVHSFFNFKKIAAAVMVIIGSVTLYFHLTKDSTQDWVQYTSNEAIGYRKITLSDGSTVILQNGSTLMIDNEYGINHKRNLSLQGQAYFDVSRDTTKPFVIKTPLSEVRVLGTSFNVLSTLQKSSIMVHSGKVKVSNLKTHNDVVLLKNESVVDDGTLMHKGRFNNDNYLAWFTGKFKFTGASMQEVVTDLNTFYHDIFQLPKDFTSPCLLTADFDNQAIEAVAEVLTLSCELKVNHMGDKWLIEQSQ